MKKTFQLLLALALFLSAPAVSRAEDWNNPAPFGSTKQGSEVALIGILYDFKQDQKHQSTNMNRHVFEQLIGQFIDSDWDEGMLNKYYRVSRPLYTTEVMIPQMNADMAPKAFGVEKLVQPRMWMIWYKAQVQVPEDGTYRFLGNADDFCGVAVNGKTVMFDHMPGTPIQTKWFAKEGKVRGYTPGDWIALKKGQVIDLDIMIGESPGGDYRALVCVEKQGVNYNGRENPFQLSISRKTGPATVIWKGMQ